MLGAIGPYEVQGELGRGGMGVVYRALDRRLQRPVAIKALRPDIAADETARTRLRTEALHLAALNHPNIAAIHGVEEDDDGFYIVMEFVEGPTLTDRIWTEANSAPLPEGESLRIARQVAAGLAAAHAAGIVHRDLKPDNVKVRPDGLVKILDFGIASARHEEVSPSDATVVQSSEPITVSGTPGYMSPEQLRGGHPGVESDIWAFGCLLYEMLVGRPPFRGTTTVDLAAATLLGTPDMALVPMSARGVIVRCLHKEAAGRPSSMQEALGLLDSGLATSEVSWRPPAAAPATRSLIGRDEPIRSIAAAIGAGRCVRVVGGAGVGASSAAEAGIAAWAAGAAANAGVCRLLIPELEQPGAVLEWLGTQLGIGTSLEIDWFAERAAAVDGLVVLVDAGADPSRTGAVLADAVAAAGGRSVLVRDTMDRTGVGVITIGPLSAPDPDDAAVAAGRSRLDAARMLIGLGGGARPSAEELRIIARACHISGGSPRAVQLVAAGGREIGLARLITTIERRMWSGQMSTAGTQIDSATRARVMTAWAIDQAGDDARLVLCASSALWGEFDAAVIAGVMRTGGEKDAARYLPRLERLSALGLIEGSAGGQSAGRFTVPRVTRAVVRASTPPEAWDAVCRAHFRYCSDLLRRLRESAGDRFERPRLGQVFRERHADLLAASLWGRARGEDGVAAERVREVAAEYRNA